MTSTFSTQTALTATMAFALAISLSACQQGKSSSPAPATPVAASKTEEHTVTREEALAGLEAIGLKFIVTADSEDAQVELHEMAAAWDLKFYREFLKSAQAKPDIQTQLNALKIFLTASQVSIKDSLDPSSLEMENESPEDMQKLRTKAIVLSQMGLAQARIERLEKKLAARLPKDNPTEPATPSESQDQSPVPAQPEQD